MQYYILYKDWLVWAIRRLTCEFFVRMWILQGKLLACRNQASYCKLGVVHQAFIGNSGTTEFITVFTKPHIGPYPAPVEFSL
jgi:hypothetical protein